MKNVPDIYVQKKIYIYILFKGYIYAYLYLFTEDSKLCYSIRDMIVNDAMSIPKRIYPRGFCKKITVRSECFDAGLVVDGGIAVPFNFGTIAEIETFPEDSLRTITLPD